MPLVANPKQIDHSTIPPAVRRQAERAEALRQQSSAPVEPQPQPEPEPQPPAEQHFQQLEPQPQPEAQPEPQPTPDGDDPNSETWQHKFQSEQGRTQKLRHDVATLSDEVSNLRGLLATMQTAASAPPEQPDPQQTFKSEITPEEIEQWGPDLIGVIEKKAREIANKETMELKEQLRQLGGRVQHVGEAAQINARQQMTKTLDGHPRVSNWRELNNDDEFIGWLQYPDPLSGEKRHDMLRKAWDQNDASRVAAFFESFLAEAGRAVPRPAQQGNGAAPPSKPSLESFAAPGKPRSAAPSPQNAAAKETVTTGDISRFYADKTAGRFKGREADADAYEREIFQAQTEGRVRPGPPSRI